MHNELTGASVLGVEVISSRKVAVSFDLNDNELLRDADLLSRCMTEYLLHYPKASSWTAEYLADLLVLTITGTLSANRHDYMRNE